MPYQSNNFSSKLQISFEGYVILSDLILKTKIGKDTRLCKKNLVNIKTTKGVKQVSIG